MGVASLIQDTLTSVPSRVVYAAVFALPFLEASVFLGFVIPGETALVSQPDPRALPGGAGRDPG